MAHTLPGPSEGGEPAALHPRQAAASEQDPPSLTDGDNKSAAAALRARLMGKSAAGSSGNRGPEAKRKQVAEGMLPCIKFAFGHVECTLAWCRRPRYRTELRQQQRPCDEAVASKRMAYNYTALGAIAMVHLARILSGLQPLQDSACSLFCLSGWDTEAFQRPCRLTCSACLWHLLWTLRLGVPLQVEVLPAVDAEGRAVPGAFGRDAVGKGLPDSNKRPRRLQRYEAGEKQRYFADDDAKDLQGLVKEQRYGGARDIDANLADNIARKARFRRAGPLFARASR